MSDKRAEYVIGVKTEGVEQIKRVGDAFVEVEKEADSLGDSARELSGELDGLRAAVDAKTQAIKAGLQAEQSEIELQRAHLDAARAEASARQQAAKAQGDEAQAMRAGNSLRLWRSTTPLRASFQHSCWPG